MASDQWLSTLDGPHYTWDDHGQPATDEEIVVLERFVRRPLPPDYVAFLRMCNGATLWHGDHWFIKIWPSGQIPDVTSGYRFDMRMPSAIPFASDGGGEALVFDIRPAHPDGRYPILLVNYVTVGWDETIPVASCFRELMLLSDSLFHAVER